MREKRYIIYRQSRVIISPCQKDCLSRTCKYLCLFPSFSLSLPFMRRQVDYYLRYSIEQSRIHSEFSISGIFFMRGSPGSRRFHGIPFSVYHLSFHTSATCIMQCVSVFQILLYCVMHFTKFFCSLYEFHLMCHAVGLDTE